MTKLCDSIIYTRVSVTKTEDESISVANQRDILTSYASMSGMRVQRVFTDDGWSGSDFQRPAFTEMMEYVRENRPDAILVTDLSRFGRDCIEMGRYTDYVLPELGCKLVAINESCGSEDDEVMTTLRSIFNDFYLMDVSNKIRAANRTMAKEGKCIAGRPPYGYRKDTDDKHKFLVDDYAAGIVRRIFEMRIVGISYAEIAAALNGEGVLSPREYEYFLKGKDCPYERRSVWLVKAVKDIMRNEAYLGHRVQLRQGTTSYKNHKIVQKPEDEWVRVEHAHPAIIDQAAWDAAQAINRETKAAYKGSKPTPALFQGLLRCAECGGLFSITRDRGIHYYKCSRYANSGGSACSSHSVREDFLKRFLLDDIQKQAARIDIDKVKLSRQLRRKPGKRKIQPDNAAELVSLQRRLGELEKLVASYYEDKVSGAITGLEFQEKLAKCEFEREAASAELARLTDERTAAEAQESREIDWAALISKHSGVQEIDRALLTELVERIEISAPVAADGGSARDIRVVYKIS